MSKFTKNTTRLLTVSVAALCAVGMTPAMAQDPADGDVDSDDIITVTGFRASLAEALDVKRNETGVVDAIVAEDIADFPDLNLAESLQRIPGISINRVAGEGRQVTVRGLGGDFTRVRINGMEALSTTGGSDASGGNNRGRGFDFNTFASDLFNEIVVRKTQSASIEEGSLGANVELKTAQPFDYASGLTAAVSGQLSYNDLSGETGPRAAGLLSWSNPDKSFGVLGSIAYTDRTILEEGFSTVRFDDAGTFEYQGADCDGVSTGPCQELRDSYYARIPRYGRLNHDQERLGLTGSVQFQPADSTLITIDGMYSTFAEDRTEEYMQVFVRSNTDNINITDYAVNSDGLLEYLQGDLLADEQGGVRTGLVPARSEHRFDELRTDFQQITGKIEHEFTPRLRGDLFGGYSKSTNDNPVQATIFFDAANPVNDYVLDFRDSLETPGISYGSLDVNDATEFLFTQYRNRPQDVENTFETFKGNLEFDLNDNLILSAGASWKQFDFSTTEIRAEGNVADLPGFTDAIPVTDAIANLLEGFGDGLDMPSGTDTSWVTADFDAAAELIDLFNVAGVARLQDTRGVTEEDTGFYAQLDFNGMLGSMPYRGDVGVRYVETTTASTGYVNDQEVTIERSYDDTLPALNLVLEPTDTFLVRGGIAKVMARPSLGNLTPGGSLDTFTGPPFSYNLGNPGLDPYRATTYDLSLEWYFAEESLLSFGLFYKDISSFFESSQTVETTFSQTGLPASVASPTSPLAILLAQGEDPAIEINQTANGGDGDVQGFELVYQQPFSALPGFLSNTGFIGNYTYVDSDTIIGFSPNAYNATVYYEDGVFAARLTASQRDAYQTTRPASSGRTEGREERGVAETFNLDASASWQVNDAFQVTVEAINLTDEFEHQTFDELMLPTVYHHTGREFLIGARWKM